MQKLIDICTEFCSINCLTINTTKTKTVTFGKLSSENCESLYLNGNVIEYVSEWKYLGTSVCSGRSFTFSSRSDLRSFYRAFNSIASILNDMDEMVLMKLLYSNCVSILTYACAVKNYSAKEKNDCHTAVNHAIRKIFSFQRYESIRFLREFYDYSSLTDIFTKAERKFKLSLKCCYNCVLRLLINL